MRTQRSIIALVLVNALLLMSVGSAWAQTATPQPPPPSMPSRFYGEIHITDGTLVADVDQVLAYVPGVTDPVGTATIQNNGTSLVYNIDVRGDDTGTSAKDGGVANDQITFKIGTRVVAMMPPPPSPVPVNGTWPGWRSGFNTRLDIHPPAPTVTNTGPVNEGSPVTINASLLDWIPSIPAAYAFDCDGNGSYEIVLQLSPSASCTFPDGPSSHIVGVQVVDNQGGVGTATTTVVVNNVAPTATFNAPTAVNEGSPINLSLSTPVDVAADLANSPGLTYAFDCGDGPGYGAFSTTSSATCPTTDNGTRAVKGKIQDKDGGVTEYNATVTVTNVAPTAIFAASSPIDEGGSSSLSFTSASDPSSADTSAGFGYSFACDGQAASLDTNYDDAGTATTATCPFGPKGNYTVAGRIFDKDGGFSTTFVLVVVNNLAPVVTAPANQTADEGVAANLNLGSFTDQSADGPWAVDVDWGDGSSHTAFSATVSGTLDPQTHTYADGPNTYTVVVSVTDNTPSHLSSSATFQVTVNNVAPTATFNAPTAVNEGSPIELSLSTPVDVPADTLTYAFDCGSGYTGTFTITSWATCTTNDKDTRVVGGKIKDKDGDVSVYTATVTINDVLPLSNANGPYSGVAGKPVTLSGTPTCVAVDACTVKWIDISTVLSTTLGTTNTVPHTWNTVGTYTVTFSVTDNDGNVANATTTVNITAATHAINLKLGWNLVSFNLIPANTSVTAVLSSVAGKYDLVYAWDAPNQGWLKADTIISTTDTLATLTEKTGFWIHITGSNDVTLNVQGSVPTSSVIALSTTGQGWNLVGYPAATNRPLPDALRDNGIGTNFSLVYSYRANQPDQWKLFDRTAPGWSNDLTSLEPGWGYWVKAAPTLTITIPWTVVYP